MMNLLNLNLTNSERNRFTKWMRKLDRDSLARVNAELRILTDAEKAQFVIDAPQGKAVPKAWKEATAQTPAAPVVETPVVPTEAPVEMVNPKEFIKTPEPIKNDRDEIVASVIDETAEVAEIKEPEETETKTIDNTEKKELSFGEKMALAKAAKKAALEAGETSPAPKKPAAKGKTNGKK